MQLTLNTPALLFPAISLLLLAYTNRFMTLAGLIRTLHERYKESPDPMTLKQIKNLKLRVILIRNMQVAGISSMFLCVVSMFLIYENYNQAAQYLFGAGLLSLIISLAMSIHEILISTHALQMQLSDIEANAKDGNLLGKFFQS
ncbi:Protein of unknown function [Flexibacter flexilis DSM 6793]|uniref:II family cellulose-binding protein n=1 Tax=Flexibacter flexilis DSM 6793 TaxID=927664 RepID=A0A1I1LPC9_9BACT|nr:DUF2721 domain-containing protein [Flexibacter flexilis]SFC74845.1 Protein of unknown function [Flexibacter flexilis DSM 6793]